MADLSASDLTDILQVTDKIIMLRFDDGYIKHYGYHETSDDCVTYNYPVNLEGASNTETYLIFSPDDVSYSDPLHPVQIGRK